MSAFTDVTQPDLFAAMRALLDHAETNELPAPTSIDTLHTGHLWINLHADRDQLGWLKSISIDTGKESPHVTIDGELTYIRTDVTGRLPGPGTRLRVTCSSSVSLLAMMGRPVA